jgi:hypothetical protein
VRLPKDASEVIERDHPSSSHRPDPPAHAQGATPRTALRSLRAPGRPHPLSRCPFMRRPAGGRRWPTGYSRAACPLECSVPHERRERARRRDRGTRRTRAGPRTAVARDLGRMWRPAGSRGASCRSPCAESAWPDEHGRVWKCSTPRHQTPAGCRYHRQHHTELVECDRARCWRRQSQDRGATAVAFALQAHRQDQKSVINAALAAESLRNLDYCVDCQAL